MKVPASTSWMSACVSVSCSSSTLARPCRCSSFSVCKQSAHARQQGALHLHNGRFLLSLGVCLCLRFVLQQILGQAVQVLHLLSLQAGSTCRSTELSLLCLAD